MKIKISYVAPCKKELRTANSGDVRQSLANEDIVWKHLLQLPANRNNLEIWTENQGERKELHQDAGRERRQRFFRCDCFG